MVEQNEVPKLREVYSARRLDNLDLQKVVPEVAQSPLDELKAVLERLSADDCNNLIAVAGEAIRELDQRHDPMKRSDADEIIHSAYKQLHLCAIPQDLYPAFWKKSQEYFGSKSPDTLEALLARAPVASERAANTTKDVLMFDPGFRLGPDIREKPLPVPWAWDGVIPLGSTTVLYGDYGSKKTSILISVAMRIACGDLAFCTRALHAGTVIYLRAEDNVDFDIRYHAFLKHKGIPSDRVAFIDVNSRIDLTSDQGKTWLHDNLAKLFGSRDGWPDISLLVVDPLLRLCPGIDLKSDVDCRKAIDAFDMIAQELGCAVVLVVHMPKGGGRKAYGSYALAAAASSSIGVRSTQGGGLEIFCDRVKCGPPFSAIKLATEVVEVETEEPDGDAETPYRMQGGRTSGLVIVEAQPGKLSGKAAASSEAGIGDAQSPAIDPILSFEWAKEGEKAKSLMIKSKLSSSTFYRRLNDMVATRKVKRRDGLYYKVE